MDKVLLVTNMRLCFKKLKLLHSKQREKSRKKKSRESGLGRNKNTVGLLELRIERKKLFGWGVQMKMNNNTK